MSDMTNYLEGKIIDHIFRSATFTKPTALYVGLFTAVEDAEAGTVTEVTGNNYARAQLDPSDTNWAAPSSGNGQTSNSAAINFPTPSGSWGLCTHFGISDSPTGGNWLFIKTLTTPQTPGAGNTVRFSNGQLTVTFA